jgi:hypothetical protein
VRDREEGLRESRPGITAGLLLEVAVRVEGAGKEMTLTRGSGRSARGEAARARAGRVRGSWATRLGRVSPSRGAGPNAGEGEEVGQQWERVPRLSELERGAGPRCGPRERE